MNELKININQIVNIRLHKSGIYNKFISIEDCIRKLFGIQSQYTQFALINILNRVKNKTISDIEYLSLNHTIIKSWGQRLTLHIYLLDDWKLINQIFSKRNNWVKTYCKKKNANIGYVLENINILSKKNKFISRNDIVLEFSNNGLSKDLLQWGGVLIQSTLENNLFGIVSVYNQNIFMNKLYLTDYNELKYENPIQELLSRYFYGYGPASLKDFKHWSGLNEYEFIKEFNDLSDKLIKLTCNNTNYFMFENDYNNYKHLISVKNKLILLGKFDPILVSYYDKS